MPTQYLPGAPNPYFPKHEFHGVPINGSYQCVEDCKLRHFVGSAATVEKAVAAYILSPEYLWATFQVEAENIVKINGSFHGNEQERNRRINAAYAKLWLADSRFQWAGLAAFASKQVGCGLLHSRQLSERNAIALRYATSYAGSSTEMAAKSLEPAMIRGGADFMFKQLGFGNMHLFLDIYPLHRFFMERGADEFGKYLATKGNKKYPAHWEIDRQVLPFGYPFGEIRKGFDELSQGHVANSVRSLAEHEQLNILQKILYNDPAMQRALAANQLAWAIRFPSGVYEEIKLSLSAQCQAKAGLTAYFSNQREAKLWDSNQRMKFVYLAADRFNELLIGKDRAEVEQSLLSIAAGGSVQ